MESTTRDEVETGGDVDDKADDTDRQLSDTKQIQDEVEYVQKNVIVTREVDAIEEDDIWDVRTEEMRI